MNIFAWLRGRGTPAAAPVASRERPSGDTQARLPITSETKPNRFDVCLTELLKHEGGYVDHPADPGGATNMGITLATLRDWRGKPVTKDDVRNLTKGEAGEIYRARYWNAVKGDQLPAGVDLALFDYAVNSGPGRAVRDLQSILGVAQDGVAGPKTIEAVKRAGARAVVVDLCDARRKFLRRLTSYSTFGRGWERRVNEVEGAALKA